MALRTASSSSQQVSGQSYHGQGIIIVTVTASAHGPSKLIVVSAPVVVVRYAY